MRKRYLLRAPDPRATYTLTAIAFAGAQGRVGNGTTFAASRGIDMSFQHAFPHAHAGVPKPFRKPSWLGVGLALAGLLCLALSGCARGRGTCGGLGDTCCPTEPGGNNNGCFLPDGTSNASILECESREQAANVCCLRPGIANAPASGLSCSADTDCCGDAKCDVTGTNPICCVQANGRAATNAECCQGLTRNSRGICTDGEGGGQDPGNGAGGIGQPCRDGECDPGARCETQEDGSDICVEVPGGTEAGSCGQATACGECTATPGCGFCVDPATGSGACTSGNFWGSLDGSCRRNQSGASGTWLFQVNECGNFDAGTCGRYDGNCQGCVNANAQCGFCNGRCVPGTSSGPITPDAECRTSALNPGTANWVFSLRQCGG